MRKVVFYLVVALAHVAAFSAIRSMTLMNQPALDPSPSAWVGLERGVLDDLVGARGEPIEFQIVGHSLGGLWASPTGLSLTLVDDHSNFRVTMPVVAATRRSWGSFVSGEDADFSIPVSFQIPYAAFVHRTLVGSITGTVEVPRRAPAARTAFGEGPAFRNDVVQVSKPIRLTVVPPEHSPRSGVANRARIQLLLSVAAFVCFAGYAAYLGFRTRAR
jgi:hypothetical protein